jgi:uncharacterized protein (DUF58 family)
MRLRLGRRVPGLALAAGLIYIFANNSQVVWLYLVCALFLGLILLSLVAPLVIARRVRLEVVSVGREGFSPPLPQDRGKLFAGDTLRVQVRVVPSRDARRLSAAAIQMGDGRAIPVRAVLDGPLAVIEIPVEKRGLVESSAVRLSTSWPAGLLTAQRWTALEVGAVAYPRYLVPGSRSRAGAGFSGEEANRRGQGDDFVGLREYRQGDPWRRIHWPTTARTGDLMVVETSIEAEQPSRYRLLLLSQASEAAQDLAIGIAASLAAGDVARGEPFRLRIGAAPELRRWSDAMGHLAIAQAELAGLPAPEGEVTTVVADGDGVLVDVRGTTERMPLGADLVGAWRLLENLG